MEKIKVSQEITVYIRTLNTKSISIKIKSNATFKQLLEQAIQNEEISEVHCCKFCFKGRYLLNTGLDLKLSEHKIEDGSTIHMQLAQSTSDKSTIWNLENLADQPVDNDITLSIWDFGNGKEVTKLIVKKTTTMRDIKKQLQQKYNLSDERINELYLSHASANILCDLNATVEQIFDENEIKEREVKACTNGFDFYLKTSENEASNGKLDIFLLIHDSNNNEIKYTVTADPNTTLINLIKDKWEIFKDFSKVFIIAFRGTIISDLNNELRLQEGDLIDIYPHDNPTCNQEENKLIKIEDLKSDLNKNNNGNYVSKTDPANKNNWLFSRIIVGIIDLFFLAAAITTFVLDVYLAIPIVLTVLCVFIAILFFGWNKIFSKIRRKPPKYIETSYGNRNGQYKSEQYEKESKITENDLETEKKNPTEII